MPIGSVEFETARLIQKLRDIAPEMHKGMKPLVKDAGKIAIRKAVEMTPPGWINIDSQTAKKRGEHKIEKDMRRVYATASYAYGTIADPDAKKGFWKLAKGRKTKDFDAAMKIVVAQSYNVRLKQAVMAEDPDPAIHQSVRKRGVVPRGQHVKQIITREAKRGGLETLIKKVQKNVGIWAAGWMPAVEKLGVSRVAGWIKRHATKGRGRCDISESRDHFQIEVANTTGFGKISQIVPYAIAAARAAMDAQVAHVKKRALERAGFKNAA